MARARDYFRNKANTTRTKADIRKTLTGGLVGGHQRGLELTESIEAGTSPRTSKNVRNNLRAPRNPNAKQEREARQAASPFFLDEIKRRLMGDRLGSPIFTKDDFNYAEKLQGLAAQAKLKSSALARKRKDIQDQLTGTVGLVRRAFLKAGDKSIGAVESLFERGRELLGRLSGDTLKRKLAGFELKPFDSVNLHSIYDEGFSTTTPYQAEHYISVQSSNVAAVAWESHNPGETPQEKTLGTLFIQFNSRWTYKYRDAPFWLFEAILRAPSKGKAVWDLIRTGLYPDGIPWGTLSIDGYERIR